MDNEPNTERQRSSWILSRGGVLVMLFIVLGPFGLGLLHKSKCFSRGAKIFLTVSVLIYTGVITAVFVAMVAYIYRIINELSSTF